MIRTGEPTTPQEKELVKKTGLEYPKKEQIQWSTKEKEEAIREHLFGKKKEKKKKYDYFEEEVKVELDNWDEHIKQDSEGKYINLEGKKYRVYEE